MHDHTTRPSRIPFFYGAFLTALVLTVGLSVLVAGTGGGGEEPQSGLRFSHKLHTQDAGMGCADCHSAVAESASAADVIRPDHSTCQSCHEEQLNESCTTCHVTDPGEYTIPVRDTRGLVFSHAFHIGQGAECAACHADVAGVEAGEHIPLPPMATCNTCHDDAQASNACESCHTNLALLRPVEHNESDFLRHHKQLALRDGANCLSCHTEEGCAECHNGAELVSVTVPGSDLQVPNGPRLFAIARGQGQNKLKVHDAGFRFTHGVLVQQRSSECQTCHDAQDFCSTCHMAGGNINQGSFRPFSHSQPGFTTVGVGSGGGLHAREARRDIEACASCHDVQAADPTCVLCHVDNDGIRGTNPRTHEPGFMAGEKGDWHEDPGANCYVCHVDPNARPGGNKSLTFCGYCHN